MKNLNTHDIISLIIVIILPFLACLIVDAIPTEKDYQEYLVEYFGGIAEYYLPNGCRVDIVTETHAIEIDFAKKFYTAIGQALYYAAMTDKTPGVVLIILSEKDMRFVTRLEKAVSFIPDFAIWIINDKYEIERIK